MLRFVSCPTPVSGCHLAEADGRAAPEMSRLVNVTKPLNRYLLAPSARVDLFLAYDPEHALAEPSLSLPQGAD